MIDHVNVLPLARQCSLLGVGRSMAYYRPVSGSPRTLEIVRAIDEIHTGKPFIGSRRIAWELEERGLRVNRKCVQRLMRLMGITAIYPKPRTTRPGVGTAT